MTKIKLADWLGLPFMAQHTIEQMNLDDFVADPVMKSGTLYHPVKITGSLANLLQMASGTTIYVQAGDKQEAIQSAMASLKTGKEYVTPSMAADNARKLQDEYERRLSTMVSRNREAMTKASASVDEQVYGFIKSGLSPSDVLAKGIPGLSNVSQVQQAYGRQVVMNRTGQANFAPVVKRDAMKESTVLSDHIKEIRAELTRLKVPHDITFIPDGSGGHFRVSITDSTGSMYGTPIKLSEAQGTLLINKEGRNGYRAINDMAIASERKGGARDGAKLYGNGSPRAVSEAIASAVSQQFTSYSAQRGTKIDALAALNINKSISSTEGKTFYPWVDSNLIQTHSEFGTQAKLTNVPQGMFPLSTGDHFSQIYGKGGAFPIENLAAMPGTTIQRDSSGRISRVIGDDPLSKHVKRTRLQAQDYTEMGYSPTQSYTPETSRVKASGERAYPQGYRAKQAFFLQALLEEGAGMIDKSTFPYIMTNFSEREEKFKIAIENEEQKAALIAQINQGLEGDKGLNFLKSNGLKSSSWGAATITGYEERDGHLYLQGSLYQETGGNMAIKSGQKAHFYNQSPKSLGIDADLATNAPSSQRQMMSLIIGSMDSNKLNQYWQQVHGTNAPEYPDDIEMMRPVYQAYAKDHTTDQLITKTITEKRMAEFGDRIKEWNPMGRTKDGEVYGQAIIQTPTLMADVLVRPKGEFSKSKSRLTSAEGGIFQQLYPDTYNRLVADSAKGREKYDIIEQVNRYNMGMLKQGMMPTLDLSEMMASHGDELAQRAKELMQVTPDMSSWDKVTERKRARAQAVNEFAPGYMLKYGQHHMGQSANFAQLAFKTDEGRLINKLGDSTDDFLDNLFNQHLGEKTWPIKLPAHKAGNENVHEWNPDEVARQVSGYQARQIDAYGTRMKSTDVSTPQIQYHTYTSDSGLGANEFARSYHAMSKLMGIKKSDPMYHAMKRAMEGGLITGTSWRSPGVNPVAQMGNVLRSVGQKGLRDRGIDIDLGKGMGAVYSPYQIYSQGGDNDSDADKFVVHTQIDKLDRPPTQEESKAARLSNGAMSYVKSRGEWYVISNPYQVSSPDSIIEKAAAHSAGELEGWMKKAKMSPDDAFEKLMPQDVGISSTELSLGSFEQKQLNSKQIGYVYDIFTKGLRPLTHESIQNEAGSLAGRFYQPPLDNKTYKRAEPIANMIEFINSFQMGTDKVRGSLTGMGREAGIDQSAGTHAFRSHMESMYSMGDVKYEPKTGLLSFTSNDAPGHKMNPMALQFIQQYGQRDLRSGEEIRAQAQQKRDKKGKLLSGVYTYSFKPDNLFEAKDAAFEIKKKLEALVGFAGQSGYLADRIYTGYDEKKGTDYEPLHEWLNSGLKTDRVEWGTDSKGKVLSDSPLAMMNKVDKLMGYDSGRFEQEFRNSLFSRTSSKLQRQVDSVNPIDNMLRYINQAVGASENKATVAREFASVITPNRLNEGLSHEQVRDSIAGHLESGDFAAMRQLLDQSSMDGDYMQSGSALNVTTRATTVRNMRKEMMRQSEEIQENLTKFYIKEREGTGQVTNDMSSQEFYDKFIMRYINSGKRPNFLDKLPDYIQSKFTSISNINATLAHPDMQPYLADEKAMLDIVQAQSLNKTQNHKWFGTVGDYFGNEQLQRQLVVEPLLGRGEVLQTVAKPKPSILRPDKPVFLEEENPFGNDPSWYGGDFAPNMDEMPPMERGVDLASFGIEHTKPIPISTLIDNELAPHVRQEIRPLHHEPPIPSQPKSYFNEPIVRPSTNWQEPAIQRRDIPKKDNIAASQLVASGSVMLLNMLEKGGKTARRQSIDSQLGEAIKKRAVQMMKTKGDYQSFMGASMDFDGGSISGNIDLVSMRDGIAEMLDLTTTSSDYIAQKQEESGLRTIAKAKLLSNVEGFGNVPIHARTVGMSPEMQRKFREYKQTDGQYNQAMIDEFASHLVEQSGRRVDGDTQRYDPQVHDPILAQGYNDALGRRDIAKREYESNFASLSKGTLKEGLFSDLLKRLPQFAKGTKATKATLGIFGEAGTEYLVPATKTTNVNGMLVFDPNSLGIPGEGKPKLPMYKFGEEFVVPEEPEWFRQQMNQSRQDNTPLISHTRLEPKEPTKAEIPIMRSNGQPQEGDIRTYATSNQTRVYTNGKWVRGQDVTSANTAHHSNPSSTQGRNTPPASSPMMFEKALTPAMLADVRRMGMADQYQERMMRDYQAMADGQLPNETPDNEYQLTIDATNKYWNKLEGMRYKAETMLSKYNMEQGFEQNNNKRGLNNLRRDIRDNGLSYADAGANAAQYGMSATEAQSYHKVASSHPFRVDAERAALAKKIMAEIDNTRTNLSQSDSSGIAAMLGQDELGKDRDISFLSSELHGMYAQNKPAMAQRDKEEKDKLKEAQLQDKEMQASQLAAQKLTRKRDNILDERATRQEVNQASISTVRPQSGMESLNTTAQGHLQAYQSAHDTFTRGGGWEKPMQEWSDATRASAREMDRNAIAIREINIQSKDYAKSLSTQAETLKAELPTLKADLAEVKKSRSEEKKLRDTFDPTSRNYAVHDTKAGLLKDEAKAISASIRGKKDEIAHLESTLSGQVKTPQIMGVEAKEGKGGKIGNAMRGALDLQNLFYASSSLANYGYMVGSPLLQARSSHIQEEYNLNRISAMMSPDGKSTRKEMTAINQQQSAFEDAYSEFSKGVYKGLAPIYNAIGKMTSDGNKSGMLEGLGQAAPYLAEGLTGSILASKLIAPTVKMGMTGLGMGEAAGGTVLGGMMGVPMAVTAGAALAAATIPGLYNTVMRGDSFQFAGYDTGMGANEGLQGKSGNTFSQNLWNIAGSADAAGRMFKNIGKYGFDNLSNINTITAIENRENGWYSGDKAYLNLTPEQAQQARENLNQQQEERGYFDKIGSVGSRAVWGYGAAVVDVAKGMTGYSDKSSTDVAKEYVDYVKEGWTWKNDYTKDAPKPLSSVEQIQAAYPNRDSDPYQMQQYQSTMKAHNANVSAMGGEDEVMNVIERVRSRSERTSPYTGKQEPTLSIPDTERLTADIMDRTGFKAETPEFNALYDFYVNQKEIGNNLDETIPEVQRNIDNAPFAPGSKSGAVFATQVFAKPNSDGSIKTDSQRQAQSEYWAKNASSLDQLGQAANPEVIQASMDMYIADWNSPGGERLARHNQAMRTGLTPGDMMSRTPYYWSNKARDASNDMSIAANADPLMREATRSLQLVDDKGRDVGFFEKRAAQDKDTRFKNEMELGAQYKDVAYIDPLDGTTRTRQEITGFSGGEMQRKLDSMMRDFTQTFGTMADIATKFGSEQSYTADGEGARWKDNRREKYGLDMTGYSDNLVSKTDYQYTMQTKGHDMQMKNYQLQLDQIDLNLKKQQESFEMSKEFGEKQKAIQLELFNLETKYKYEDLEIAKGKAAKQYGRQMEDYGTQRERLGVTHGWKMDDFNTQEYRGEVGRSWQLQDNAYNRETFDLQSGWQSDDFERNIKYASGRQRIDMKRQYERQLIMNNLKREQMYQGEQRQVIQHGWQVDDINKNRGREETQFGWGNDDISKGEKRAGEDFATAIGDIDRAKSRLDETIPLQRQLIELSNEYWKMQMDFQSKYMKEEEAIAMRQKAQIAEKMAMEQWQFEQQMGWFEIDKRYQEEKALKDMELFAAQKTHAEEMAIISENLLRIDRQREVATIAMNTQMHLGFDITSKMYPAMQSMAESAVRMSGGTKQAVDYFVVLNNQASTLNMTLEKTVSLMGRIGNGSTHQPIYPTPNGQPISPTPPRTPTRPGGADNNPNTPFATGGYTGNISPSQVAGIVHGQEFVIPHQGSPVLREPQVVNLLSAILDALKSSGSTQVVIDGEVISRVVDRTIGNHFNNVM